VASAIGLQSAVKSFVYTRVFEKFTFSKRLFLMFAGFGLLMSAVFATIIVAAHRNYYAEVIQADAMTQVERAAALFPSLGQLAVSNREAANTLLRNFPFDAKTGVYVIDAEGSVLASSGQAKDHWANWKVAVQPLQTMLLTRRYGRLVGDDPDQPGERCLFAVAPIELAPGKSGYLYIQLRAAQARSTEVFAATGNAIKAALWIGLIIALAGIVLTIALLGMMTRPLRKLTAVVDAIQHGGVFALPSSIAFPAANGRDEISRLSAAFQLMLERIRRQIKQLERTDSLRRELVASVSHDLRSPLTSLMGNLETIKLKGDQLATGDRNNLIDIALNNSRQIDRLSSSLFELAVLDSDEFKAAREPMAIGDLIDDIVLRFNSRAEKCEIQLVVELQDHLPLLHADASLIERMIVNLLDNALRYTPKGGQIKVSTAIRESTMVISVADTGIGIPESDFERIFDRFYQGNLSRDGHGHAGLGLAIVRRIVELHEGTIQVQNNPTCGCCFHIALCVE
jgi:two-component system, OmpR family, sensor kinase